MSDMNRSFEMTDYDDDRSRHRFAFGLLAGAAVGVGVGMLLAPTKGAEARKYVGKQLAHMKGACATGYSRAKDTAGDWAYKGRQAYGTSRGFVARRARGTGRYMRDVADALTMKTRREASRSESGLKIEEIGGAARDRARPSSPAAHAG